jgi:hypothetical protein
LALKDRALAKIANLKPTPDPEPVGWNLVAFLDQIEGKFVHQVDTFTQCLIADADTSKFWISLYKAKGNM